MLCSQLQTFSGRPNARRIKPHCRSESSYNAFEASDSLMNRVLIKRGFPNQFRTLMEWDGSYPSPLWRVTARKGFWSWRITVGEHRSASHTGHCLRRALLEWERNFSWEEMVWDSLIRAGFWEKSPARIMEEERWGRSGWEGLENLFSLGVDVRGFLWPWLRTRVLPTAIPLLPGSLLLLSAVTPALSGLSASCLPLFTAKKPDSDLAYRDQR